MNVSTRSIDTAHIGSLRLLLQRYSTLKASIGDFVRFRVVVDANVVIRTLLRRARYPERGATALEELIHATVFDVFAPRWLEAELATNIPKVSRRSRVPEADLWARWAELRPLLKWDDELGAPATKSTEDCVDPKDLPYILLANKISADGILTNDSDIARMGGHPLTFDFILSAQGYARAAVITVSIRVLGTAIPAAAVAGLAGLLQRAARRFAALPNPMKVLLVVGAATALVHPASRRWIADRCIDMAATVAPVWLGIMEIVRRVTAENNRAQLQAVLHLYEATKVLRPRLPTTPGKRIVRRRRPHRVMRHRPFALPALAQAGPTAVELQRSDSERLA